MTIVAARRYAAGKVVDDRLDLATCTLPGGKGEFDWIGVADPTAAELELLQRRYDLHPLAVEDALMPRDLADRVQGLAAELARPLGDHVAEILSHVDAHVRERDGLIEVDYFPSDGSTADPSGLREISKHERAGDIQDESTALEDLKTKVVVTGLDWSTDPQMTEASEDAQVPYAQQVLNGEQRPPDEVARPYFASRAQLKSYAQLRAAIGDVAFRILGAFGRGLAAGELHPNQLFIGASDERFAIRQGAKDVVEVPAAIGEAFGGVEQPDCHAQAIQSREQLLRHVRMHLNRAVRACRQNHAGPHLCWGKSGEVGLLNPCANRRAAGITPSLLMSNEWRLPQSLRINERSSQAFKFH